jgi:putative membrane protein
MNKLKTMTARNISFLTYLVVFIICAINPYDREVWFAENLPIVLVVFGVYLISRKFEFSNTSYIFMAILPVLHTIGGHYTFELVPFDFITNLFEFERNHYDRIAHFSVGLYAYAICEYLTKNKLVKNYSIAILFAIFAIFTTASVYEIIEWWYAISADESAGIAVLGSQGDIWDAQKDMLADGLGAIFASLMFYYQDKKST